MSGDDDKATTGRAVRLVMLIIAGLIAGNVLFAVLFERDTGLGMDDLLAAVVGVGLALAVEYGVFRRLGR